MQYPTGDGVIVRLTDEPDLVNAYELLVHFYEWFLDQDLVDFAHEARTAIADLFDIEEVSE